MARSLAAGNHLDSARAVARVWSAAKGEQKEIDFKIKVYVFLHSGTSACFNGDVGKHIASAAMAILGNLIVHGLVNTALPIDHFIASAHLLENKMKGRLKRE